MHTYLKQNIIDVVQKIISEALKPLEFSHKTKFSFWENLIELLQTFKNVDIKINSVEIVSQNLFYKLNHYDLHYKSSPPEINTSLQYLINQALSIETEDYRGQIFEIIFELNQKFIKNFTANPQALKILLPKAITCADLIEDDFTQAKAFCTIANIYTRFNNDEEVQIFLKKVLNKNYLTQHLFSQSEILVSLFSATSKLHSVKNIKLILEEILEIARSLDDVLTRIHLLLETIKIYSKFRKSLSKSEKIRSLLEETIKSTSLLTQKDEIKEILSNLFLVIDQCNLYSYLSKDIANLLNQVLEKNYTLVQVEDKADEILTQLANHFCETGDLDQAYLCFREAINYIGSIEEPYQKKNMITIF